MINWAAIGAVTLGLGVVTGAFGAHALRDRLDAYLMGIWEKAVFYHFVHALGLLIVPLFINSGLTYAAASRICWLLLIGILLFSGSLYALALTGTRALGAVTPFGGTAFILGWLLLAVELFRSR